MLKNFEGKIAVLLPISTLTLLSVMYVGLADTNSKEVVNETFVQTQEIASPGPEIRQGLHILIRLDKDIIYIKNGTETVKTINMVSQGKPGSYYETIAGTYTSDFQEENHFSTLGQVYMPYSTHLFGNYFIHGIPYFPDGSKVSSAFSGGCIRLEDADAKYIYSTISSTTPIIITRKESEDFLPTKESAERKDYRDMTRIMMAIVSLEALPQDTEISFNKKTVSRKDLLKHLLSDKTFDVSILYSDRMSTEDFLIFMNQKAKTLGLTNTTFNSVYTATPTSSDDYYQFMYYVRTYKSFLLSY